MGMRVVDLRDDKERQIERKAYAGESLGPEVDRPVAELTEIGRKDGYLSMKPGGKFDESCRSIHTRKIGEMLDQRGGMDLMQAACYRVRFPVIWAFVKAFGAKGNDWRGKKLIRKGFEFVKAINAGIAEKAIAFFQRELKEREQAVL